MSGTSALENCLLSPLVLGIWASDSEALGISITQGFWIMTEIQGDHSWVGPGSFVCWDPHPECLSLDQIGPEIEVTLPQLLPPSFLGVEDRRTDKLDTRLLAPSTSSAVIREASAES